MSAPAVPPIAHSGVIAYGETGELGCAAFWQRVNGLIEALNAHPGGRWALVCDSTSSFAAGLVALSHTGRTIVVPPAPQAGSLRACQADVAAVLTDQPAQFSDFNAVAFPPVSGEEADTPREINAEALIEFYTSGSSDRPGCVRQHLGMLLTELNELEREWGARMGDAVVISTVPHYHRYGLLLAILWPLVIGRTFHDGICVQPSALRAAAGSRDCAIVSSPAFLSRVQDGAELPPVSQVQTIFSSGAPLPDAAAERLARDWGKAPIEIYGSTETGGIAWRSWSTHEQRARWQPLTRAEIELRPEAAGDRLWVRTPFTVEWMPSGDLARNDADGSFVLLGRADGVVKVEDKRVSLNEMRSRLLEHPWVVDARLILLPGERMQIGAAVVLDMAGRAVLAESGRGVVREALRACLREVYEPILVPRRWRFVERWPDNSMAKVTQDFLRRLFEQPS
ncbi:MAG TPA: AMP-binding protein [Gammaproteobacteria bacterium]|nr:AMP-binding protein [Gammaproteobacteria bacterium]